MGAVMTRCVDCWIFNFMNRSVLGTDYCWLVSCRHDSEQSVSSAARVRRCDGGRPSAKRCDSRGPLARDGAERRGRHSIGGAWAPLESRCTRVCLPRKPTEYKRCDCPRTRMLRPNGRPTNPPPSSYGKRADLSARCAPSCRLHAGRTLACSSRARTATGSRAWAGLAEPPTT